jgi:hypothetical protein
MTEPIDHVATGLKRIGHQYGHSEKFRQWIAATLEPLNQLEAVFLSLLDLDLDTAQGVVLDLLGRIVGAPAIIPDALPLPLFGFDGQDNAQPFGDTTDTAIGGYWRESGDSGAGAVVLDEAQYRIAIQAQILKNGSDCTPDQIIEVINLLTSTHYVYVDGDMWIGVGLTGAESLALFERRLIEVFLPRPAGVGLRFFDNWIDGFGWADQPDSLGFGDTTDSGVGGFWTMEI